MQVLAENEMKELIDKNNKIFGRSNSTDDKKEKKEVKAKAIEMLPAVKELPIALPKVVEEAVAPVELPELPVEEAPADSTTTEPTTNEGDE